LKGYTTNPTGATAEFVNDVLSRRDRAWGPNAGQDAAVLDAAGRSGL